MLDNGKIFFQENIVLTFIKPQTPVGQHPDDVEMNELKHRLSTRVYSTGFNQGFNCVTKNPPS